VSQTTKLFSLSLMNSVSLKKFATVQQAIVFMESGDESTFDSNFCEILTFLFHIFRSFAHSDLTNRLKRLKCGVCEDINHIVKIVHASHV